MHFSLAALSSSGASSEQTGALPEHIRGRGRLKVKSFARYVSVTGSERMLGFGPSLVNADDKVIIVSEKG